MSLRWLFHRLVSRRVPALLALATILAGCMPFRPVPLPQAARPFEQAPRNVAEHDLLRRLPLQAIENRGQRDPRAAYYVEGRDTSVYFRVDGLTIALMRSDLTPDVTERWAVELDFLGAEGSGPVGARQSSGAIHDLRGDPDRWHTNLRSFGEVVYPGLWPGIDLVYRGGVDELKYELLVQPHADVDRVALAYRGATSVEVAEGGDLVISTPLGSIRDAAPYAYQEIGGQRVEVPAAYRLERHGDAYAYGIELGAYDPDHALVIDPAVPVYAGFVGGLGREEARAIAVDADGYAYIAGSTIGSDQSFPIRVGPDTSYNSNGDVFVAKVRPDGSGLVYAGFIGGSAYEEARGIAVDGAGNAYVTGYTLSGNFPLIGSTVGYGGAADAFVVKVKADGSGLVYASFIGGHGVEEGNGIAVDGAGNAYVVGATWTTDGSFPASVGPGLTYGGGNGDGFITKVAPDGSQLLYSGYVGGADIDEARAVAVDAGGNAYVTGYTFSPSPGFPLQGGPDTSYNGGGDAFVVKVRPDGTGFAYGGYVGGAGYEEGHAIAVDTAGRAYLTGYTLSTQSTFEVHGGPSLTASGNGDMFVAKLEPNGGAFVYAGFVGGSGFEEGNGIAAGNDGSAYVTGSTWSGDFPAVGAPRMTPGGAEAAVVKIAPSGSTLMLATAIGGAGDDLGQAITLDRRGSVYLTGSTDSNASSFPVVTGPAMGQGGGDAFVARFALLPDLAVTLPQAPTQGTMGTPLSYVVAVENRDTTGAGATDVTIDVPLPLGLELTSATATQGSCGPHGTVVVCTLGTLASRGSASVTLQVTPRSGGTMQVRATVTLDEADPDPANNSAMASTAVGGAACAPRPKVTVTTARGASGELIATATASSNPGMATNLLRAIKLGVPLNAKVDIGSQRDLTAPTTVTLQPGTQQAVITVRRVTAGQAATVPLTIVDDCGEWQTFVGGGPSAF